MGRDDDSLFIFFIPNTVLINDERKGNSHSPANGPITSERCLKQKMEQPKTKNNFYYVREHNLWAFSMFVVALLLSTKLSTYREKVRDRWHVTFESSNLNQRMNPLVAKRWPIWLARAYLVSKSLLDSFSFSFLSEFLSKPNRKHRTAPSIW